MSQLKRKILEAIVDEDPKLKSFRLQAADLIVAAALLFALAAIYFV